MDDEPLNPRAPLYGFKLYIGWGSPAWLGYFWIGAIFLFCIGVVALFVWVAKGGN